MVTKPDERAQLRGFVLRVLDFMVGRLSDPDAASLLKNGRDPIRRSQSLRGLREAASDMVEWCQDLTPEMVAELDQGLSGVGLPSLSAMRDHRYRSLIGILARKRISSESDYRLLAGWLADVGDPLLSTVDRDRAERMLAEFQIKAQSKATSRRSDQQRKR